MGRNAVPGAQKGDQGGRLRIVEEANHRLYVRGTITILGQRIRVRKSTRLDSRSEDAWERARAIARKTENQIEDQIVYGVRPSIPFAELAAHYLSGTKPGQTDLDNAGGLIAEFGETLVSGMTPAGFRDFYARRFPDAAPATIRRHKATLTAILNHGLEEELIDWAPRVPRTKVRQQKGRARGKRFLPGEAELIIEAGELREQAILATLLVTGARPSMVLYLPKTSFVLALGRGRIFFPRTKNGNAYDRPLHDYAVEILLGWLDSRTDGHPEMFLTPKRRPYRPQAGRGGQIAGMFNRLRDQAVAAMVAAGYVDRARVIAEATPKWFRHSFANTLRIEERASVKDIMEAGIWESPAVVLDNYFGDEPEHIEAMVRRQGFGKKLTKSA